MDQGSRTSEQPVLAAGDTNGLGRARWGAGQRRRAVPLFAGAVALLLAGGAGGYLLAGEGGQEPSSSVDPAASVSFDPATAEAGPDDPDGFGPGHRRGFGRGGWGAVGTIDSVDGTTIMLTTRDGRKVTVTAAGTVPVILRSQGAVADLKPGQTVLVAGSTGSDGSVIANRISVGAKVPK